MTEEESAQDGLQAETEGVGDTSLHDESVKRRELQNAKQEMENELKNLSAFGKPSRLPKEKLMQSEGIIPIQSGTNKYASQRGMTGFGRPRDVIDKVKCENLPPIEADDKSQGLRELIPLQSGTNKYASQKGMTGFGCPRDVMCHTKGTGGTGEIEEDKAKATDGVIPLQAGTNKLASQQGMTGFGMPRSVLHRFNPDQDRSSQGFVHLQAGTNKLATQQGMTSFGSPRTNVTKYKDTQRGELVNDESVIPRQTVGYRDGANQSGMTGFGMPRNTTNMRLSRQEQKGQGLIPFQMGISWGDSQSGKTGFGMPRQVCTQFVDDTRGELPEDLARMPDVPFWTGMEKFASQNGMTAMALYDYYQKRFKQAAQRCTKILQANPYDKAAWCLKLYCLTSEVRSEDIDLELISVAGSLHDEEVLSFVTPSTALNDSGPVGNANQNVWPRTRSSRPVTGVLRPETRLTTTGRSGTAVRTGRPTTTSFPGRYVRMGTASMLGGEDGQFINVSRLNLSKYANDNQLSKPLFEYLFFNLEDISTAFQLAQLASRNANSSNWYWNVQIGRCYARSGQFREAEKELKKAHSIEPTITTALYLSKIYCTIEQPLKGVEVLRQTLGKWDEDTSLLKALSRIYEDLNNINEAESLLKRVLKQQSIDIEAIAWLATNYFYNNLPELALRFYRRILQMGVVTAEVYLNIGLCCFHAHIFDIAVDCLEQAIRLADDDQSGDVWYNIGYVALATGDLLWAKQCFNLCLMHNTDYAEAWSNLAVIEMHEGNADQACSLLKTAMLHGGHTFEPFYNYGLLMYKNRDFLASLVAIRKALEIFPQHAASKELLSRLCDILTKL